MNQQPFYHRVVVLFTATSDALKPFEDRIRTVLEVTDNVIPHSVEIEEHDAEAGDPQDLV